VEGLSGLVIIPATAKWWWWLGGGS